MAEITFPDFPEHVLRGDDHEGSGADFEDAQSLLDDFRICVW